MTFGSAKVKYTTASLAAAAIIATGVILIVSGSDDEGPTGETPPGDSGIYAACDGHAKQQIKAGVEYTDAPDITCLVVEAEGMYAIGATTTSDIDLVLQVTTDTGVFWAAADDTFGSDPELSTTFLPGTYIITVTDYGGGVPGNFTLYTRTEGGPAAAETPGLAECGTTAVPMLQATGSISLDNSRMNVCLSVAEDTFVTIGAITPLEGGTDLTLTLFSFNESGEPEFYRWVDDSFGVDPEMRLDLTAGTYLAHFEEFNLGAAGAFEAYLDTDQTTFRESGVSAEFATLTGGDCTDGSLPSLTLSGEHEFTGASTVAGCFTLTTQRRILVGAASHAGQDLTLEVIGFSSDGSPVRVAWTDDYLWAENPSDIDPRIDLILPAGRYALAASTFSGEAAKDASLSVTATS